MKAEIGSEFWNIPLGENNFIFPKAAKWFLSGRVALQAIIKENNFKTVALPDWCCESMIIPFINAGISIVFYPAFEGLSENVFADAALVMDYFGYMSNSKINGFRGMIIRDVTHSIFSNDLFEADYCFGSLRKWAGFWTGGYAWGFKKPVECLHEESDYVALRQKAMSEKALYIEGLTDSKGYLNIYESAEEKLEKVGILPADQRDIEVASKMDIEFIRKTRRKNADMLLKAFSHIAVFKELNDTDCPLFVPIRVKNRNELRKYLIQHEIYCPVHWPKSQYHNLSKATESLYDEELSLVCDQRYTERDMQRIITTINDFFEKEA